VVKQNAARALTVADRGCMVQRGRNRFAGTGAPLLGDLEAEVKRLYLGG
jgi:ABC-type branched-subunit amino acid transport system ATPase component